CNAFAGSFGAGSLASAGGVERDLVEVLGAPAQARRLSNTPTIQNLVFACHSGGGAGMRSAVDSIWKSQQNLAECWGLRLSVRHGTRSRQKERDGGRRRRRHLLGRLDVGE